MLGNLPSMQNDGYNVAGSTPADVTNFNESMSEWQAVLGNIQSCRMTVLVVWVRVPLDSPFSKWHYIVPIP